MKFKEFSDLVKGRILYGYFQLDQYKPPVVGDALTLIYRQSSSWLKPRRNRNAVKDELVTLIEDLEAKLINIHSIIEIIGEQVEHFNDELETQREKKVTENIKRRSQSFKSEKISTVSATATIEENSDKGLMSELARKSSSFRSFRKSRELSSSIDYTAQDLNQRGSISLGNSIKEDKGKETHSDEYNSLWEKFITEDSGEETHVEDYFDSYQEKLKLDDFLEELEDVISPYFITKNQKIKLNALVLGYSWTEASSIEKQKNMLQDIMAHVKEVGVRYLKVTLFKRLQEIHDSLSKSRYLKIAIEGVLSKFKEDESIADDIAVYDCTAQITTEMKQYLNKTKLFTNKKGREAAKDVIEKIETITESDDAPTTKITNLLILLDEHWVKFNSEKNWFHKYGRIKMLLEKSMDNIKSYPHTDKAKRAIINLYDNGRFNGAQEKILKKLQHYENPGNLTKKFRPHAEHRTVACKKLQDGIKSLLWSEQPKTDPYQSFKTLLNGCKADLEEENGTHRFFNSALNSRLHRVVCESLREVDAAKQDSEASRRTFGL